MSRLTESNHRCSNQWHICSRRNTRTRKLASPVDCSLKRQLPIEDGNHDVIRLSVDEWPYIRQYSGDKSKRCHNIDSAWSDTRQKSRNAGKERLLHQFYPSNSQRQHDPTLKKRWQWTLDRMQNYHRHHLMPRLHRCTSTLDKYIGMFDCAICKLAHLCIDQGKPGSLMRCICYTALT